MIVVILRKPVAGLSETTLSRFTAKASRAAGLKGQVSLLVTSNRELRSLNRRFRGKDKPTDVLSFPAEGKVGGLAGDIAISAEIAGQNARRLGHPAAVEIKVLVLHGVLHLAGYDHESDQGEMARREAGLRHKLGLPVGLIERSGARSSRQPMKRSTRTKRTR
jgi:probable rRNA maturation factor